MSSHKKNEGNKKTESNPIPLYFFVLLSFYIWQNKGPNVTIIHLKCLVVATCTTETTRSLVKADVHFDNILNRRVQHKTYGASDVISDE